MKKRYRVVRILPDVTGKWQKQILPGVQKKKWRSRNQKRRLPLEKTDEKKKECAERDAKQQAVKKKRNYEMSL